MRTVALALLVLAPVACDKPAPAASDAGAVAIATSSPPPAASSAPAVASAVASASAAPEDAAPLEKVGAQHVLIAYKGAKNAPRNVTRTKAQARKLAEEVLAKARSGQDFAGLARTYSDDPGSKDRLGSVGTFKRDGMVKPFSDAAFALQVNQISDVVETPFGFHVIKRFE